MKIDFKQSDAPSSLTLLNTFSIAYTQKPEWIHDALLTVRKHMIPCFIIKIPECLTQNCLLVLVSKCPIFSYFADVGIMRRREYIIGMNLNNLLPKRSKCWMNTHSNKLILKTTRLYCVKLYIFHKYTQIWPESFHWKWCYRFVLWPRHPPNPICNKIYEYNRGIIVKYIILYLAK